jgi:riboflavin synthase
MFTGLVEDLGTLVAVAPGEAGGLVLTIAPKAIDAPSLSLGESIAVDGVCLTVTRREPGAFQVLAGPETLARTTLGDVKAGTRVNLERAMSANARFGGHMVAGHVDGVGRILHKIPLGPGVEVVFAAPPALLRYVVEKGSIAVDGISLTVNRVDAMSLAVALIPHTLEHTTLGEKREGQVVNLEVDIVGKYVEKLLAGHRPEGAP